MERAKNYILDSYVFHDQMNPESCFSNGLKHRGATRCPIDKTDSGQYIGVGMANRTEPLLKIDYSLDWVVCLDGQDTLFDLTLYFGEHFNGFRHKRELIETGEFNCMRVLSGLGETAIQVGTRSEDIEVLDTLDLGPRFERTLLMGLQSACIMNILRRHDISNGVHPTLFEA